MCGDSPNDFYQLGDLTGGLVLTDPPYGIEIVKSIKGGSTDTGGAKPFGRVGTTSRAHFGRRGEVLHTGTADGPGVVQPRQYMPIENDDKPFDPAWLLELGKAQIIFGGQFFASKLRDGTAWLCWDKGADLASTFSGFELAWTSFEGRARMYKHKWSGMVREGSRRVELKDRLHPTQKPVGLMEQILESIGRDYVVLLDPYCGSGTTIIAAERQGRTCYAMEIEPRYVDASVNRWETYTGQKAKRISDA